ncbi:MAG: acyloxyacyl hydrolase [Bacteroidia bacterium]
MNIRKRYKGFYAQSVMVGILVSVSFCLKGQNTQAYFSFEGAAGRIVPNYTRGYPQSSVRVDGIASLHLRTDNKKWSPYFNYPDVGISLLGSYLGNSKIFGNQFSVYPYINFKFNNKPKPFFFKFGIGLAHFTTYYDAKTNPKNLAIGSPFSWHFNASFGKTLTYFNKGELRFTGGYFHSSNGHTQIPNYGLNSALLGLEYVFGKQNSTPERLKIKESLSYWVIEHRSGLGFHELAGIFWPVGTPKYGVFSTGFNLGYVHREHIKYKAGLYARYYNSYYNYIINHYGSSTIAQAGNIYLMAGAEFLLGHVGIDIEGGLNLYKPLFEEVYYAFGFRSYFDYWSKALFNTRLGLNYYLFDNYSNRKWNVKIGAHINANFGQADFSDASVGVVRRIKD